MPHVVMCACVCVCVCVSYTAGSLFKKGAKPTQPLQRVVLARRGPGSVLGDDALRDKQMVVSAVVHR